MRPARLDHAAERLDEPVHDPAELEASLDHVAAVNRWLGGRRALLRAAAPLLPAGRPVTILDVGTGSADLPRTVIDRLPRIRRGAIDHVAPAGPTSTRTGADASAPTSDTHAARRRRRGEVTCFALDRHAQILEIARRRCAGYPGIQFVRGSAFALPFADGSLDLAILSLTLHHFEGEDRVRALRELARVACGAILVNELERSWPNYLGAQLLAATVWRRNRLTRHDGPLSVLRAFTPAELLGLGRRAGLRDVRVRRFFPWRVVLTASAAC